MSVRWLVGDLLFEPDRFTRVRMRVKGVWHGILRSSGRLWLGSAHTLMLMAIKGSK